ncbi:MAG: hypothetical protein IKD11_03140 [Oscillospiraceae bacterium]|nr:hypothetical protein [Oscillospiraceae bacterium]
MLGTAFALVYDLLRSLRMYRKTLRSLTAALDILFALLLAAGLLVFARRVGGGELRLYMLFSAAAGAAVFFICFSPLLRPLWDFWAQALFSFLALLRLPMRAAATISGKLHKRQKRLFLFYKKSFIIKTWGHFLKRKRRSAEKKEGVSYGQSEEKAKRQRSDRPSDAHTRLPSARTSSHAARTDQSRETAGS